MKILPIGLLLCLTFGCAESQPNASSNSEIVSVTPARIYKARLDIFFKHGKYKTSIDYHPRVEVWISEDGRNEVNLDLDNPGFLEMAKAIDEAIEAINKIQNRKQATKDRTPDSNDDELF